MVTIGQFGEREAVTSIRRVSCYIVSCIMEGVMINLRDRVETAEVYLSLFDREDG